MGIRIPTADSAPTVAFEDAVQVVFDALGEVPDSRDPRGKQIELKGTLALAVISMAAGHSSHRAIEKYGVDRSETLIPLLGLDRPPSDSTIRRIVLGVDPEAVRGVVRKLASMLLGDRRKLVTAKDGKVMRASRIEGKRSAHMAA